MAIIAAMAPLTTARIFMGLEINPLVAPTICMVLIKKRLLYIAKRMVLSISTMERRQKIIVRASSPIRIRRTVGATLVTTASGYVTLSTVVTRCNKSLFIAVNVSLFT